MSQKNREKNWARESAVVQHDETASWFANKYDATHDDFSSSFAYGRAMINRYLFKQVSKLKKGAKILDVGCGTGDYVKMLSEMGFEVVGIEPSSKMRTYAQSKLSSSQVIDASVTTLPFKDNSFDFVYSIEVFRYLSAEDNVQGFREILRVLKPNGVFFSTFLNLYAFDGFVFLVALRKLRKYFFGKEMNFHSEFETEGRLRKKLTNAGFSHINIHGAMVACLVILYRINMGLGAFFARLIKPVDVFVSDMPIMRNGANYLIGIAEKQ